MIARRVDSPAVIEAFKAEHRRILAHLDAKDAFYGRLVGLCRSKADLASANIATIFNENMTVQSQAIRRFLGTLDNAPSPLLSQSFSTMALIIKNRLATEERGVSALPEEPLNP